MSVTHKPSEVRLDNGTLWIGTDAYPLHTITRVTAAEVHPERTAAVRNYAIAATSWLFPATIASAITPKAVSALITLTALAWFTLRTTTLVQYLRTTQHELIIETTSAKHRALVSVDRKPVEELAFRIMDALS
jgi:Family of unknown function (DUF6232)